MRKALAVVLALATLGAMSNPSQQPTITISPIPPQQGQTMVVTYTGGTLPVTLELDWDPAGTPTSVTIPRTGSAKVTVPANATSVIISDPTPGGAPAASSTVGP